MSAFRAAMTFLVILVIPTTSSAELDAVQLRLLEQYDTPLRWDNVEPGPYHLGGVLPQQSDPLTFHTICLKPGQSTCVLVPPLSMVRIESVKGTIRPSDLVVWLDNGSGLSVRQNPASSTDGKFLLVDPDDSDPCIARICCPDDAVCARVIAVYLSRRAFLPEIAPYREPLPLNGDTVRIRRDDEPRGLDYYRLDPALPQQLEVDGPVRLAVHTLLRYRPREERLDQTWRIAVFVDDQLHKHLEFETTAEYRHHMFVDQCEHVLGRLETAFTEIPCGHHTVRLDSTAPVYLRVAAQKSPDYLLPGINAPALTARAARQNGFAFDGLLSPWHLTRDDFQQLTPLCIKEPIASEKLAWRSARDNGYLDGGLHGYLLLRDSYRQRRDAPEIRRAADDLRGRHTFYRDLLPASEIPAGTHRPAWFNTRRLLRPGEPHRDLVLSQSHIDDALDNLSSARFVAVGDDAVTASVYQPPTNRSTTLLRVAVDRASFRGTGIMYLRFDDRPPIELRIAAKQPVADGMLVPSESEAALLALQQRHSGVDAGTLGGPFTQFRIPAAFIDAPFAELLLPNDVCEIRVWSPCGSALGVALQYRVSRPFRLSESQFLEMCCRSGCAIMSNGLGEKFPFTKPDEERFSLEEREVANHLAGWYRQVRVNAQWFSAGVERSSDFSPHRGVVLAPQPRISPDTGLTLQKVAQDLASAHQPLASLETWKEALIRAADPEQRRSALYGRIDALATLGEQFLHERQLRGLFLYDSDPAVREQAGARLWQLYREQNDLDSLTALLCAAVVSSNHSPFAEELSRTFLERGQAEEALLTALMLPPEIRPTEAVLTAAYQLRWWQTFDAHLCLIDDPEVRSLWQARRELDHGAYNAAEKCLREGGTVGQSLADHLAQGRSIAAAMQSRDLDTRTQAILDSGTWHATQPGPHLWREDATLVSGSAGTAIVRAFEHDSHAIFYRAKPGSPLRLSVPGPVRLKVEMRPVHSAGSEEEFNDWIRIRSATRLWPVAIVDNRASEGLEITGSSYETVGTAVEHEMVFGPGLHEIAIKADAVDVLVRVHVWRPQIPLPVLPPLTQDTMHSVLAGTWATTIRTFADLSDPPSLYLLRPGCCDPSSENVLCVPWQGRAFCALCDPVTSPSLLRPEEPTGQLSSTLPEEAATALLLGRSDWRSALNRPPESSAEGVLRRMTLLLFLRETVPELAWECVVAGEKWMQSHPKVRGLQPLHRRLTGHTTWIRSTEMKDGAGIRRVTVNTNLPESPAQRTRAALLSPLTDGEYRIYGDEVLVLRLRNQTPTSIRMSLRPEHLEHLPEADVHMTWAVDDQSPEILESAPGESQEIELPIEAGSHFLRIRLLDPFANQYLRIGLQERPEGRDPKFLQPVIRVIEKDWFVATQKQPLRFNIRGPAWVRIDELQEDHIISRYADVLEPVREFTLSPPHGKTQSLFRVFLKSPAAETQERPPLLVRRGTMPIPEPLMSCYRPWSDQQSIPVSPRLTDPQSLFGTNAFAALDDSQSPPPYSYLDEYSLGGQEDGTWAMSSGFVSRRPLGEGITGTGQDEFAQAMATCRYFDEFNRNYWTTDAMFRGRFTGTPSLGLRNSLWHDTEWIPASLISETSGYIQNPGQAIAPAHDSTEFSLNWRGEIRQQRVINEQWYHTPSASVYARYLSMNNNMYPAGRVDQDIFTSFKSQHRVGLILTDALTYQPWLDTQFWLRGALNTNEDLNLFRPDHVYMRLGWRQLIGCVDFETTYRITRYFADSNRSQAVTQHLIDLDLVHDVWAFDRHLGESGVYVQHDIIRHATTAGVSFTLYLDNGRGYRDFPPGNIRFRNARRFREAVHANNQLWQVQ